MTSQILHERLLNRTGTVLRDALMIAVPFVLCATGVAQAQMCEGTLFTGPEYYQIDAEQRYVATGDVNNDGYIDMVAPDADSADVLIYLGTDEGTFGTVIDGIGYQGPGVATIADFNNDGNADLYFHHTTGDVSGDSIWLGDGTGAFSFHSAVPDGVMGPTSASAPVARDVNLDGNMDVIGFASDGVRVLLGDGTGVFPDAVDFDLEIVGGTQLLTVGKLDGNVGVDIAVVGDDFETLTIILNDGSGVFEITSSINVGPYPRALTSGDFNADGFDDLAVIAGGDVSVVFGDAAGTFDTTGTIPVMGGPVRDINAADFNGDGFADLAIADQTYLASSIRLFCGTNAGQFVSEGEFAAGVGPAFMTNADLGND